MSTQNKKTLSTKEIVLFALLGSIMLCSKILMQFLPNIHLIGMLTMTYTLVFRKKALIPIYVYIFADGLYFGFSAWWIPYLYIWTILWAVTMMLPQNMKTKTKYFIYPLVCSLHGLLFGTLYSPVFALIMGMNFKEMIAYIISGLSWDAIHGAGNLVAGSLILPLSKYLCKLLKQSNIY